MILAIIAFWLGYKKAKATGRNPWLWSAACGFTFIGAQVIVGFLLGFTAEIFKITGGSTEGWFFNNYGVITVTSLVASFLALWLVFRYLDRPIQQPFIDQPPPPPTFSNDL